jgi:hypothetical protein
VDVLVDGPKTLSESAFAAAVDALKRTKGDAAVTRGHQLRGGDTGA